MNPILYRLTLAVVLPAVLSAGCSPAHYRTQADQAAAGILAAKQREALGRNEPFEVEAPSDTFRRRLLAAQNLPVSGPASYGSDNLPVIAHWPEKRKAPVVANDLDAIAVPADENATVTLTLV